MPAAASGVRVKNISRFGCFIDSYFSIFAYILNTYNMKDYIAQSETIGKYLIEIIQDNDPESPREWDNMGTMVCFHPDYVLGDKHDYKKRDYSSWAELLEAIIKNENVAVILPLYLYDHSGITISTSPFSCPWDSGQVGFIFVTKETVRKELNVKRVTRTIQDNVSKVLIGEVETYDQFLTGDVYGYRITDTETDEELDSCWGFYGQDCCMTEAKEIVDYHIKNSSVVSNVETI